MAAHGGTVYKQTGDGYLVLFESAEACLETALELGIAFGQLRPLAADDPLLVRLALHGGDLQPSGEEYFGPALNRVSRICQICNPGQVLMSDAVGAYIGGAGRAARQQAAGRAACATHSTEFKLQDLGQHHLRDLAEPERLYQLDSEHFRRHEFPPLSTLNNRPNNLVSQPNHFIGRERELKELATLLLEDTRLLTITAPGGYGKSRLAAQLCANLLHRFERGVFMAYLAPLRDSTLVTTAIANALGFQFSGRREPEDQLCDYLREKDLLLCLDNFEHVLECAPLVRKFLDAAAQLKILTTSREPLRLQGEQVYKLDPLPVAAGNGATGEAELLFADRATLVDREFVLRESNRDQLGQICAKLSGIPLAIELAAAWMDTFTLSELSNELSQQLELEARTGDRPARQRSLKASLDWSWQLLGEEQQAILMKLSTFRGGFFSEAASELLGLKGMALRSALGRLADKSWLYARDVNGRTRFFLRDMLAREYAFGKLQQSELYEPAVIAHAAYFSALMAREGPRLEGDGTPTGQSEALATVRLEHQNIDEALDTLLRRSRSEDNGETASLLLPIARRLWKFLALNAAHRELVERYQALQRAAEQAGNLQQFLLYALLGCSHGQARLGDYDAARDYSNQANQLAQLIGDRFGITWSLSNLGLVERCQGNYEGARKLYAESLAISRELGDRHSVASSLDGQGLVDFYQGNYDAARGLFAESLAISRELGDRHGTAWSLSNQGIVEFNQGNYDAARALHSEALDIRREIGDRHGIAVSLNNLALVEHMQGNLDAAREQYIESLAFLREIGDRYGVALALNNLGSAEYSQGNYDAAREMHVESLAIRRGIGDRWGIAASLINLADIELNQGNYEAAGELFTDSLAIEREIGDRDGESCALHGMAVLHYFLGEYAQANELLRQAVVVRSEIGDHSGLCESLAACTTFLATGGLLRQAAFCLYGTLHQESSLGFHLDPMERELLERALEMVEHPNTGLPAAEREQLKAQAEAMSIDELAKIALDALGQLKSGLSAEQGR